MASEHRERRRRDALDDWIAEVGEDYVADLVKETKRGVADGTIQAFSDKNAFLLHLERRALDKPA